MIAYLAALLRLQAQQVLARPKVLLWRLFFRTSQHGIYLLTWALFFYLVPTINGWQLPQTMLGYGLMCVIYGLVGMMANGLRFLARDIGNGDLDNYLLQPKPLILNLSCQQSDTARLADVVIGVAVIIISNTVTLVQIPQLLLAIVGGVMAFVAFSLAFSSLAFWINDFDEVAQQAQYDAFLLAVRPTAAYTGLTKFIMLTILPVFYMTYLPVESLVRPSWAMLGLSLLGSVLVLTLACGFFYLGLKRYESGNRFGVRS